MNTIISHPGKPLIKHLHEVAKFNQAILLSKSFNLSIDKWILGNLGYIQGAIHDIGKATKNFQTYIKSGGEVLIRPKHHALISAFIGKNIAEDFLKKTSLPDFDKKLLSYFLFTSIKRHHGNVLNFTDELENLREKEEDLKILSTNFYEKEVSLIINELLKEIGFSYDWTKFKTYMSELEQVFFEFEDFAIDEIGFEFKKLPVHKKSAYFFLHHTLFSALLFSDKTDVKLGDNKGSRISLFQYEMIKKYRDKKGWNIPPQKEIDKLKNKAYLESLKNLEKIFDKKQHLYSITLPTGLGKTITSLALAMKMKKKLATQNPRIIITIPFTSIIDQNYQVFNEIFENPSSNMLLKHHHLAEPKYKEDNEDQVKTTETSQFLIETWQSEIVVTTFVQLLESIFTNRKGKLLKLNNLINSIIILDEVQQIKYEYWELIKTTFKTLGEKYNCYFILMSATQPLIFTPPDEITELIINHKQYFNFFNRTKIINETNETITLEQFCTQIIKHHKENPSKDILAILNTRKSTLQCFEQICSKIPENEANLYFLSTLITPFERKKIIEKIKKKPTKLPNIIISTQLIEAGVDISVHTVFRALAPLDSIIQAAGRANRYWENREKSDIFLYRIEEIEKATNKLYGPVLINKTRNVLQGIKTIEEKNYLTIIENYFKEIKNQSENISSQTLQDLLELKFEDVGKFDFIEYRKVESVFIQLSEKAKKIWEKYVDIYSAKELSIFEKKEKFALIKADFYDYVINVPVPYGKEHITFDSEPEFHFYISKLESPSQCYHYDPLNSRKNTGYVGVENITLNY